MVLCVRCDDLLCCKVQHVAEIVNCFLLLQHGESSQESSPNHKASASSAAAAAEPYQIVRVDFGECQATADKHGVKSMPAFMMFFGGRLAWAGTLGGVPIKAAPPETAAAGCRVLLVEPCAKVITEDESAMYSRAAYGGGLCMIISLLRSVLVNILRFQFCCLGPC